MPRNNEKSVTLCLFWRFQEVHLKYNFPDALKGSASPRAAPQAKQPFSNPRIKPKESNSSRAVATCAEWASTTLSSHPTPPHPTQDVAWPSQVGSTRTWRQRNTTLSSHPTPPHPTQDVAWPSQVGSTRTWRQRNTTLSSHPTPPPHPRLKSQKTPKTTRLFISTPPKSTSVQHHMVHIFCIWHCKTRMVAAWYITNPFAVVAFAVCLYNCAFNLWAANALRIWSQLT